MHKGSEHEWASRFTRTEKGWYKESVREESEEAVRGFREYWFEFLVDIFKARFYYTQIYVSPSLENSIVLFYCLDLFIYLCHSATNSFCNKRLNRSKYMCETQNFLKISLDSTGEHIYGKRNWKCMSLARSFPFGNVSLLVNYISVVIRFL